MHIHVVPARIMHIHVVPARIMQLFEWGDLTNYERRHLNINHQLSCLVEHPVVNIHEEYRLYTVVGDYINTMKTTFELIFYLN